MNANILLLSLSVRAVKVDADAITQVEKYAYTVEQDERFRHQKTRWSFWVISNDLDGYAARTRTRQKDKPPGLIAETDNVKVWVRTWSEILTEGKARMRFVQEHLQANVDKETSLRYLKRTYDKYLMGVDYTEGDEAA